MASFLSTLLAALQTSARPVAALPALRLQGGYVPTASDVPLGPPPNQGSGVQPARAVAVPTAALGPDLLARVEALEASQGRIIVHLMQSGIPLGAAFGPTPLPPA